ncbi:unnamed protein product [Tuber melanosporum]|uniref:(Perigord truffle) hypothetical protein n=1 Tax=Tuber melanosporum (strain Mel28) TaxID=656061 RepID=D5G9K8_TUBMM|nr:uncharacterized protein GSTUM_00003366001 [Tuber melanosporum]CAZ81201.1 unnamed protein product [Tuber melanosporum]
MSETDSSLPSKQVPLASLAPGTYDNEPGFFVAIISLLWPFSPSSSSLSILASEKDFRLRKNRGQVRVNFTGLAASVVDQTKLQIGDRVIISLEGVEFQPLDDATERDVPWVVVYSTRLAMKVKTTSGWSTINIAPDLEASPTLASQALPTTLEDTRALPPSTPLSTKPFSFSEGENEWSTPGLFKRSITWLSNEPSSSPLPTESLFGGDDDYDLEHRSKRPRFSNSFRLLERGEVTEGESEGLDEEISTRSPKGKGKQAPKAGTSGMEREDQIGDGNVSSVRIGTSEEMSVDATEAAGAGKTPDRRMRIPMPPPPLSPLDTRMGGEDMPDSPSLRPVLSANLPLISPFMNRGLSGADYMSLNDTPTTNTEPEGIPVPISSDITGTTPTPGQAILTMARGEVIPKPSTPEATNYLSVSDQRRASLSDDERQLSDIDSEKDSLFDEPSDGETAHHLAQRRKMNARFATTSQPSKLSIEITSSRMSENFATPRSGKPKTPFLYLPTPSPKVEKRSLHFPTSALPKISSGYSGTNDGFEFRSPTEGRRSFLWGEGRGSFPSNLSAYFGRPVESEDTGVDHESPSSEKHDNNSECQSSGSRSVNDSNSNPETVAESDLGGQQSDSASEFESGVTTNLSDFPALCSLTWGALVDIIGVVTRRKPIQRAKGGQKDFFISMRLVDSSTPYGIAATALRPHKEALPIVEVGDVVLLREFKISSVKRSLVATSTSNSAWAVWKNLGKERAAVVSGPPVEYGPEEEKYVEGIGKWYGSLDAGTREDLENDSGDESGEAASEE